MWLLKSFGWLTTSSSSSSSNVLFRWECVTQVLGFSGLWTHLFSLLGVWLLAAGYAHPCCLMSEFKLHSLPFEKKQTNHAEGASSASLLAPLPLKLVRFQSCGWIILRRGTGACSWQCIHESWFSIYTCCFNRMHWEINHLILNSVVVVFRLLLIKRLASTVIEKQVVFLSNVNLWHRARHVEGVCLLCW